MEKYKKGIALNLFLGFKFPSLFLLLALACPLTYASDIRGVGTYRDLGSDLFLATVDTENGSLSPDSLFSPDQTKTIEIRFLETMSKRRWSSYWTQSIAINNDRQVLINNAQELADILTVFADDMVSGDTVKFIYSPDTGTTVSLNGINLAKGYSVKIFDLFLSAFVGSVPPSSRFKQAILGEMDTSEEESRFALVQPSLDRISKIKGWGIDESSQSENGNTADEQDIAVIAEPPSANYQETPSPETATATDSSVGGSTQEVDDRDIAVIAMPPNANSYRFSQDEAATGVESADIATPEAEATQAQVATLEEQSQPATPPGTTGQEQVSPTNSEQASGSTGQLTNELPDQLTGQSPAQIAHQGTPPTVTVNQRLSVESILAQQDYTASLVQAIYKQVRYPAVAVRRNYEDSVRATVTVNKTGEVKSITIAEESRYKLFNKEVIRAIEAAQPFPALPDALVDDELEVDIPVSFRLSR